MSLNTSEKPVLRQFTAIAQTNLDNAESPLGPNVQTVNCTIKIVDARTKEAIKFDPKTMMIHPSGGRIQIKGVISRDGTGKGMPADIPDLEPE